ncbi:tetratricopeptide repeat protein [Nocardia salmonicida]|uniref:tetratricopeptide repeat protein n=1 Tax=Nocardia salmonicida TaxID=53431 RepID=UPI0033F885D0
MVQTGDNATAQILELPAAVFGQVAGIEAPAGIDNLPSRPGLFVGRRTEVEALDAGLSTDQPHVVQAVSGLGGVGKSTLVAQWATTRAHAYSPKIWITAASPAEIAQGLADFAVRLHPMPANVLDANQLAERGLQWLATHTQWLLILDNVENLTDISDVLARVGTGGRIVVTSRRSTGWQPGVAVTRLGALEPDESRSLLVGLLTSADSWDDSGVAELCAALGHLPLAIEQAGAYLRQSPFTTVCDYLRILIDQPVDVLARAAEDTDPERTIAKIWRITLDRVSASRPAAVELLRVLAWYGPDAVPYPLLLNVLPAPQLNDALGVLTAYSLIVANPATPSVSIHRLVQTVARTADPTDVHRDSDAIQRARRQATRALHTTLPDHQDPTSWQDWRTLLPHIDALTSHSLDASCEPAAVTVAAIHFHTGVFLHGQGLNLRALEHLESALAIRENILGSEDSDTLEARDRVARSYRAAGRTSEAIEMLERTHTDRIGVLGALHPCTLTSSHNLAYAYEVAGRSEQAMALFENTLSQRELVLGADHPETLSTRSSIARMYRATGRAAEAITLFEQTLIDSISALGSEDPNTLSVRSSLAHAYLDIGRTNEAIDLFEQTKLDCARVLGNDHPNTFSAANNLASAYQAAGRLEEAVALFEQTLFDRDRVLGSWHVETLDAGNNLARVYRAAGRTDEAIELFEQTRTHCMSHLGPEHLTTLRVSNNLASAYQTAARIADAVQVFEQNLNDRRQYLGPYHPMTLVSCNNLADAYLAQNRHEEAIELLTKAFDDCRQTLGHDHTITTTILRTLEAAQRHQ